MGPENRSNSIIGSAVIHTQADSGSSVSSIPKRGVTGNTLEVGVLVKKNGSGKTDHNEVDIPSDDQDYLHANIAAGIVNSGVKRR